MSSGRAMLRAILFGLPAGIAFVDIFGHIARVDGVSMQPCLNPDPSATSDFVFLSRWRWKKFNYSRGDVVSLCSPKDPTYIIIKRIIALEGDKVETLRYSDSTVTVPQGHCWVEGDHTGHSFDSNYFGPVAVGLIQAKATRIVWPPTRWQVIQSIIPEKREYFVKSLCK